MVDVHAGRLDRRIQIQFKTEERDAAGDQIAETWGDVFKLWARRRPQGVGIEAVTEGGVLRSFDLIWQVRDGPKARSIAPETHRVLYKGRIYEIVGIREGIERADLIDLLVAGRPDQRGSRGTEGSSGQP